MIKHESAFDLFQQLNIKDENRCKLIIDRLNRYHEILFSNGFNNQSQSIELLDNNRIKTKNFLQDFTFDYIHYIKYRNELLLLSFKSEEIFSNSSQSNKHSIESEISTL